MLWQDPRHPLGTLIHRFPRGPQIVRVPLDARLSQVIQDGSWNWPVITDIQYLEITEFLSSLEESDTITWNLSYRQFTNKEAFRLFQPPGPKVSWYVLLLGPYRIPRNCFLFWLAILGRSSTLDRALWQGSDCSLFCTPREKRNLITIFFYYSYSQECLRILNEKVSFAIPNIGWLHTIAWATCRWRGRHPMNAASRALLASLVYHIWMECNARRFSTQSAPPENTAHRCMEQIRTRLLGEDIRPTVQKTVLYCIWKIPWDVN
ncbi:UNVERIFIED_CONTAM: hypothetical protein Slati_3479600 [Sesamum latifolium]|uniref:Reverse transcriptase zinc-binding domain-containing protein n=1 Tax=Sesamum latifolium TaxID=2727402 RepID=A0AAW2UJF2_9LAMI